MKRTKLIIPALSGLSLVGVASAALTSCSCQGKEETNNDIEIQTKTNKIVGNQVSGTLTLSLKNRLSNGQTLKVTETSKTGSFTFEQPVVSNNIITVEYTKNESCPSGQPIDIELQFDCVRDEKIIWSCIVKDFTIQYDQAISLKNEGDKEAWTKTETGAYTYQFTMPEALPEDYTISCIFNRRDDSTKYIYGNTDSQVTIGADRTTASVNVGVFKQEGEAVTTPNYGENVRFDLMFVCFDKTESVVWSQSIKNFALFYTADKIPVPIQAFDYDAENGIINKVDWSEIPSNVEYNTLEIPKIIDGHPMTTVADSFWENSMKNESGETVYAERMDAIKNLVICYDSTYDGCCTVYGQRAFSKAKITSIDFSQIPSGIKYLEYGLDIAKPTTETANDGAFSEMESSEGSLLWDPELSQYKRAIIKSAMYGGGLTSLGWYNIFVVDNRSDLVEALHSGANIRLNKDIQISTEDEDYGGQLDVYESGMLDLNGHKIYASQPIYNQQSANFALLTIWNRAEFVITDLTAKDRYDEEETGGIVAYNCNDPKAPEEWKTMSTEAIDVRTALPDREQALLEIMHGQFWGNETCIESRMCPVYIEGGAYHVFRTNFEGDPNRDQMTYDRILNCVDSESGLDKSKYYANFFVYGGKFYGEYRAGSWNRYLDYLQGQPDYKWHPYKQDWDTGSWPEFEKAYEVDETGYIPGQMGKVTDLVDLDECFYNPFWTYSEPNRIKQVGETSDKPYWWTWIPNSEFDKKTYKFTLTMHKHDNTNVNYTEVRTALRE